MLERIDRFTGKPTPRSGLRVRVSKPEPCPHCNGLNIVEDCWVCGAPVCCEDCCAEETKRMLVGAPESEKEKTE